MTELDSPFFYPYTGKSYCFYCKKPCEHDKFIDLYKKVKAKKDYIVCLEHIKARSEHYLKLIDEGFKKDIVRVVEEARNKLSKKRTMMEEKLNKVEGFNGLKQSLREEVEREEPEQPEKESPRDIECGEGIVNENKKEKERNELLVDYSDVLEDDERYWKENYTDTPNQCHYCKDDFEYTAKKEDKEIRFCRKHYFERANWYGSPFTKDREWTFNWIGEK